MTNATPRDFARLLRRNLTDAEQRLWSRLRRRQVLGWKFRRQLPIGPYIADFVCLEAKIVVEIDGGQHGGAEDHERDEWLDREGYRVLRFWNNEVLAETDAVLEVIAMELRRRGAPPDLIGDDQEDQDARSHHDTQLRRD